MGSSVTLSSFPVGHLLPFCWQEETCDGTQDVEVFFPKGRAADARGNCSARYFGENQALVQCWL